MSPTRVGPLPGPAAAETSEPIAWQDNFDGTSLNTSMWDYENIVHNYGLGSGQLLNAVWKSANAVVGPGTAGATGNTLQLRTIREETNVSSYGKSPAVAHHSSASIITKSPYDFVLGQRLVVRQRFHNVIGGHRPCIWVTSRNGPYDAWGSGCSGEIDFPEYFGSTGSGTTAPDGGPSGAGNINHKTNHYALHWAWSGSGTVRYAPEEAFTDTGWHIYELEWRDRSLKMIIDGRTVVHLGDPPAPQKWGSGYPGARPASASPASGTLPPYPAPYDAANRLKTRLSNQWGGKWCQPLEPSAVTASIGTVVAVQEVDYIRCFDLT